MKIIRKMDLMESAKQFDNLINALSKLTATQEAMGKQINEMKTQMNDRNRQEASTSAQPSTRQQQQNQFGNNQQIVVINNDIEETEVSRNSDSQIRTIPRKATFQRTISSTK